MTKRALFISLPIAGFFICLIILLWGAGHLVIHIFSGAPATLNVNGVGYPLPLGEIPLATVFFTLAVVTLNLFNEINGFRISLGLGLAALVATASLWGFIHSIPYIPYLVGGPDLGAVPALALDLSTTHLARMFVPILCLYLVGFIFACFRWLFKNGFYIVRYFLSHVIGLILASAFMAAAQGFTGQGDLLAQTLVISVQTLTFFFILFPLHYFIKWPALIFAGSRHRRYLRDHYGRVKTASPAPQPPPQPHPVPATVREPVEPTSKKPEEDLFNPFSKEEESVRGYQP